MGDIVEKLTGIADASRREDGSDIPLGEQCREAASEIKRLRGLSPNPADHRYWEGRYRDEAAEVERLRSALAGPADKLTADFESSLSRKQLLAHCVATVPCFEEARKVYAKLMLAGDDGSWAGETDLVKIKILQTVRIAEALAAEREECAKVADHYADRYSSIESVAGQHIAAAIRART